MPVYGRYISDKDGKHIEVIAGSIQCLQRILSLLVLPVNTVYRAFIALGFACKHCLQGVLSPFGMTCKLIKNALIIKISMATNITR